MHPKVFLETATELTRLALQFDQALDHLISTYFAENGRCGSRERASLSSVVYGVMRQKLFFEYLAQTGEGSIARRLAILSYAFGQQADAQNAVVNTEIDASSNHTPFVWRDYLNAALSDTEQAWLSESLATEVKNLDIQYQHNLPEWLVEIIQQQLGMDVSSDTFISFINSLHQNASLDLRVNTFKSKRPAVLKLLKEQGLEASLTPYSPWGLRLEQKRGLSQLPIFNQGLLEVQDEGSQLLALALDAKRGETVVDFCAGGGGKTLALGAMMRNTGRLYAFDTSAHRLEGLQPRMARSGLNNIHTMVINNEKDARIQRMWGKVDRVLVDAPCTGLGTLRRNPALKWRVKPKSVEQMVQLQSAILRSAAQLLKPGGRLIYATCSLLPQENEEVAQAFSQEFKHEFEALPMHTLLAKPVGELAHHLCTPHTGLYLRLWPHLHHTDGFFAASWTKK